MVNVLRGVLSVEPAVITAVMVAAVMFTGLVPSSSWQSVRQTQSCRTVHVASAPVESIVVVGTCLA